MSNEKMTKLNMNLGQNSYDIIIMRQGLKSARDFCNLDKKTLIVTDENVPTQYADILLSQCKNGYCLRLPSGEDTKSFKYLQIICQSLLDYKFTRSDTVIALGGGVIGDLAGFAAASYMRGISFINMPTTTLSQIDSSIGGKTAINLGYTKNIIGAFYQPKLVLIDPDTLQSLPHRHYINGLAEAIKAGLLGDKELFNIFENGDISAQIEEILYRSLLVKKRVVEEDEKEQGLRATLNFGHTIGHAIESANGLSELYHGECVALGILPMIESPTLKLRVEKIYQKLGLPWQIKYDAQEIYSFITNDKKASGEDITIVTLQEIGKASLVKIQMEQIKDYIKNGI